MRSLPVCVALATRLHRPGRWLCHPLTAQGSRALPVHFQRSVWPEDPLDCPHPSGRFSHFSDLSSHRCSQQPTVPRFHPFDDGFMRGSTPPAVSKQQPSFEVASAFLVGSSQLGADPPCRPNCHGRKQQQSAGKNDCSNPEESGAKGTHGRHSPIQMSGVV